ncbi:MULTISPECIES: hypothetical protein [Pseudomonas syringae group]|uniref:hypothetical protein n=1 Tax=Pseudomonas syringae group TaxID=136849 RepID=UPI000F000912|nr:MULTISPECIES: hypothetical protein [Pseudomonas syringae group]MCF5746593.1 hypothetical protein [Pseudomonas tremae]UQB34903.1 hypothetical protein I9H09_15060 [Pseudomonas tremae]
MTQPKERPILFSAPMVRAILSGQKTVTRREVKKQAALDCLAAGFEPEFLALPGNADLCPYGGRGDRLWVGETWGVISHDFDEHGNMIDWKPDRPASKIREMRFGRGYYSGHVIYRADSEAAWAGDDDGGGDDRSAWKPSIHMPRIASRILLEITDVQVERLHAISRSDIRAEGLECPPELASDDVSPNYRDWYPAAWRDLWESINGVGAWDANPWVWVVEFKRVKS